MDFIRKGTESVTLLLLVCSMVFDTINHCTSLLTCRTVQRLWLWVIICWPSGICTILTPEVFSHRRLRTRYCQEANSTRLYFSVTSESSEAVKVLDQCLESMMNWMRANALNLNLGKTEALWVSGFQVCRLPVLMGLHSN